MHTHCPAPYLLATWEMLDLDERAALYSAWLLYDHDAVLSFIETADVRRQAVAAYADAITR